MRTALAVAIMLAGVAPAARAQVETREGIYLQNQILELKQELQQLQQFQSQAAPGQSALPPPSPDNGMQGPPPGASPGANDMVAQLVVRVTALEEEMRSLKGRLDEMANTEQHDHDDLAKQVGDLAFKLGQGGATQPGAAQAQPGGDPPGGQGMDLAAPPPRQPPPPPPAKRGADAALKQGSAALARRDYPAAEAAAREVLALGHGPKAAEAQYLLARALYGEHQYKFSAASFYAVYKASPKAPRGAEGLLGVSNALIGLGDMTDACQALAKFTVEFPHPEAVLRVSASSIRKRASCR